MAKRNVPVTQESGPRSLCQRLSDLRAGAKVAVLVISSVTLLIVQGPWVMSACALVALILFASVGRCQRAESVGRAWVWFALMLVMLGAYQSWATGWETALVTIMRLLALVLLAFVVMRTTSVTALMGLVEWLMQPLGRLGWVKPQRIALLVGLTLRFMPVLAQQWGDIRQAQSARGLHANPVALLVPMLVRTLQRAEEISQALEARSPQE